MRVVLIAPPGAGKGTQGQRIAERYGVPHFSSGELFRREVARDSAIGKTVRSYLEAGDLVPDDLVIKLLLPPIEETALAGGGYVLDGFPRTVAQAKAAAERGKVVNLTAQAVLHLTAPEDQLVARLMARGQHRKDDTPDTIRHRLKIYADNAQPLLDYYAGRGLLININASAPTDGV